jgi:hypothetical protein
MSTDERKYDVRTLERNLERGLISKEEYDKYLASLADVADKATKIEAKFEEGVLDEEE